MLHNFHSIGGLQHIFIQTFFGCWQIWQISFVILYYFIVLILPNKCKNKQNRLLLSTNQHFTLGYCYFMFNEIDRKAAVSMYAFMSCLFRPEWPLLGKKMQLFYVSVVMHTLILVNLTNKSSDRVCAGSELIKCLFLLL